MSNSRSRLSQLFYAYVHDTITDEQRVEFLELTSREELHEELNALLKSFIETEGVEYNLDEASAERIFTAIRKENDFVEAPLVLPGRWNWKKLAVAASVLAIGSVVFFKTIYVRHSAGTGSLRKNKSMVADQQIRHDNATLTLSDGTSILLDTADDGTLAFQGRTQVSKRQGQITYKAEEQTSLPQYNTISTSRGNQYQLVLSDGTKVWLNASSSIRFPASFSGGERRVEITGEAYFEVAQDAKAPFKAEVGGWEITVLGTSFDVNAYSDEAMVRTTLLQGAVRISRGNAGYVLKPGQQAGMGMDEALSIKNDVAMEEVIAWKNGNFVFQRQDIKTIMRQISRWYDVEVIYEHEPTKETFSGIVSRKSSLPEVLKIMEENGVTFRMDQDKKLIVQ
ncbi:MAG TPA: FecR domain-containing protein [Puia sp.]|nr:FecR domain-containing protein [Puia sp.]